MAKGEGSCGLRQGSLREGAEHAEKSSGMVSRRRALAGGVAAAATAFFGPWKHLRVYANASDKPLRIGAPVDLTGVFVHTGAAELRGIRMAIAEFNAKGGVLGRPVEDTVMDTRSSPDIAPTVALELIERENVAFMVGAIHSLIARRLSDVAQEHGVIYMNTNSSAPSESGKNCHRTKFIWDGSGKIFAMAVVRHAMRWLGRDWFLLGTDFSWGQETVATTRQLVEANGGRIVGTRLVPQGTNSFAEVVREIEALKPDVAYAAIATPDLERLRAHAAEEALGRRPAWISNQQNWPEVWLTRAKASFGIFTTNWYHKLELPGVAEFVGRYRQAYPDSDVPVPGNVFYNAYMATRELLQAVERAGTTNNIAVIKALEGHRIPAVVRMQHHDAWIDPNGHRVQQTIYMSTKNLRPADETDLFSILSHQEPAEVLDPETVAGCRLEPYDSVATYEP